MNEYAELVAALAKPGEQIKAEMTAGQAHLLHMAVGVAGEAGELLDAIKKNAIYGKPLDLVNVIEELGDLEFYMQGIRAAISVPRGTVLACNMEKLRKRYSSGAYSNGQAQERADKQ